MNSMIEQLLWFSITVLPLVAIPGPDMMLCISQGLSGNRSGVWRAVNGITLGYLAHGVLAAIGIATLVVSFPILFDVVRWIGITYLSWIVLGMLARSFAPSNDMDGVLSNRSLSLIHGFWTSFLNPKGLFVYLSIIPQFIEPSRSAGAQAFAFSFMNVVLCYVVYTAAGLTAASSHRLGVMSSKRIRIAEGLGGILMGVVIIKLIAE